MSTYIHVKPQIMSLTDVCDFLQRVEGSQYGGPSCGANHEGERTLWTQWHQVIIGAQSTVSL